MWRHTTIAAGLKPSLVGERAHQDKSSLSLFQETNLKGQKGTLKILLLFHLFLSALPFFINNLSSIPIALRKKTF